MTKEELVRRLTEITEHQVSDYDPEYHHKRADNLILKYIGDPKVDDAFRAIEKWYA